MPLSPGETLERRYKIEKKLGEGGFGAVYRAYDTRLDVFCAVKESFDASEEAARQFKRGATMLASLRHSNLPRVTDFFDIQNKGLYLVMDFVEGEDLLSRIQRLRQPLPEEQVLAWLRQICDALTYIHTQNPPIIHRDIKPQNIIIDQKGNAILVDFGLAKLFESGQRTSLGARGLTPGFASVEQYGSGATDARSDIYSLGATAYVMLTAQVPPESIQRVVNTETLTVPHSINPRVSELLSDAIVTALEIDPRRRHQTAREFSGKLPDQERQANTLTLELAPGVSMEFVRVPAGEFLMGGDPEKDNQATEDEFPQHTVQLDEYLIGKYPVTNRQYSVFIFACDYPMPKNWKTGVYPKGMEDYPVSFVSWDDAKAFCDWVSKFSGHNVSLPTEAEWEKAARGTDGRIYPWGNATPNKQLCSYDNVSAFTSSVESYSPQGDSPYSCVNMAGNIFEWVTDWYDEHYYKKNSTGNPPGPSSGKYKVLRGGSFYYKQEKIRSSYRHRDDASEESFDYGFRCLQRKEIRDPHTDKESHGQAVVGYPEKAKHTGLLLDVDKNVKMEFLYVPSGVFIMGSDPKKNILIGGEEQPQHNVYLDEYLIGKHPVTNRQYNVFVQNTGYEKPIHWENGVIRQDMLDHPVVNVSWMDAVTFCKWFADSKWSECRLPTEAEWEKAARGVDGRLYPWGDQSPSGKLCNIPEMFGYYSATPIGDYSPAGDSPYGCTDMTGNVHEWVADWYDETYYQSSPSKNPAGPSQGTARVYRGGTIFTYRDSCYAVRSAQRQGCSPESVYDDSGFRVVLPLRVSEDFQVLLPKKNKNLFLQENPPVKTFPLPRTDIVYENDNPEEPTTITIKQADQGTASLRAAELSGARKRISYSVIRKIEVTNTVVGCNMLDSDGNPFFKFLPNNGGPVSKETFWNRWNILDPDVANEIYICILEMNPSWDPDIPKD